MPIAFVLSLPGYLLKMKRRGNFATNFWQRFGVYSAETKRRLFTDPPIWIHAVSVGECMLAFKLIETIKAQQPEQPIVLTCTTSTGYQLALSKENGRFTTIYNPFDLILPVALAFRAIQPRMLVLVEAELWPNVLNTAKKRGIPIVLVNARLSPRSERRYRKLNLLTRPLFQQLDQLHVQAEEDINRWSGLGVEKSKIIHTGSIKYDHEGMAKPSAQITEFQELLKTLRNGGTGPIILTGSTHPGEEALIGQAFLKLKKDYPDAFLVAVPRHFERAQEVVEDLQKLGFSPTLKTDLNISMDGSHAPKNAEKEPCLVVNTTGELRAWYFVSDLVLIGKSFLQEGGQNPIEPIIAGKAVIMGPNMENFEILVDRLLAAKGAVQLKDNNELLPTLLRLLNSPEQRAQLTKRGQSVIQPDQGATSRSVAKILES